MDEHLSHARAQLVDLERNKRKLECVHLTNLVSLMVIIHYLLLIAVASAARAISLCELNY